METLNKNKEGFFLMIEGSQIDWAAHDHNTIYIVEETLDLDRTIGVVLDFAERVGETLVIVTADHETGGMTLTWGDNNDLQVGADYSTDGHTGIAVPVFAFGPGADQFTGFYQNTEIFKKIKRLLKL
jgi:alkaline phosphatase